MKRYAPPNTAGAVIIIVATITYWHKIDVTLTVSLDRTNETDCIGVAGGDGDGDNPGAAINHHTIVAVAVTDTAADTTADSVVDQTRGRRNH